MADVYELENDVPIFNCTLCNTELTDHERYEDKVICPVCAAIKHITSMVRGTDVNDCSVFTIELRHCSKQADIKIGNKEWWALDYNKMKLLVDKNLLKQNTRGFYNIEIKEKYFN